ncbi:MAG: signal peptidase I [Alkalicoccus sp.]|nr:MAG: signal peptidase I [Alkalicoccus sp.]
MVESGVGEWVKTVMLAVIFALAARYFLFAPILVDGQSMLPALNHEDRMLVNKIGYFISEPDRFDIIVFEAEKDINYIKRVIGLPGDEIAYRNNVLYINNEAVEEDFLTGYQENLPVVPFTADFELKDLTSYKKVPEDHLFVLGDNRQFSRDSRHIGVIPYDKVLGEAEFIIWPINNAKIVD